MKIEAGAKFQVFNFIESDFNHVQTKLQLVDDIELKVIQISFSSL